MTTKRKSGFRLRRGKRSRSGPITAIELDGLTVHAATGSGRGVFSRVASGTLEFAANADRSSPEAVGQALAAALRQMRFKPGPVAMGVPRASVLLRTLSLPAVNNPAEAASLVHLQIGRDLPFRADEAVIDFMVRQTADAGATASPAEGAASAEPPRMEVLAAVVKRDVLDYYTKLAAAAHLNLVSLGLVSYANARCVEACRVAADGGVAIVTLRPDEAGIDVIDGRTLLFSRGVSVAGASGSEAGAAGPGFIEAVTIEVVRSLHSHASMGPHNPVSQIVVAGATGQEAGVAEALRARLSISCAVLDVAERLDLSQAGPAATSCPISALGLALGANDEAGLPFDFLNPKRPAVARDPRKLRLLLGAAAAAAVLVFLFGLRAHLVAQKGKLKDRVAQELAEAKKKRPLYRQMRQQVATVQEWAHGSHNWLEHYAFLTAVLPPSEEIYITSLSISGSGAIRLSVQARSGQILAKLDKQLRAAGYDVKPLAITPGEDKNGYDFRSTVEIEVPPKMTIDLTKVRPPARPADDASLDGARKGGAQ